jgi:hypothetical protein
MSRKAKKLEPPSKRRTKIEPWKITMGRGLFFLNAALWLGYGVYIYYDMAVVNGNTSSADLATLFVMITGILILLGGIQLGKPPKWTYALSLAAVIISALASLINVLDLFFMISLVIDLLILWIIIPLHRQYFPKP